MRRTRLFIRALWLYMISRDAEARYHLRLLLRYLRVFALAACVALSGCSAVRRDARQFIGKVQEVQHWGILSSASMALGGYSIPLMRCIGCLEIRRESARH